MCLKVGNSIQIPDLKTERRYLTPIGSNKFPKSCKSRFLEKIQLSITPKPTHLDRSGLCHSQFPLKFFKHVKCQENPKNRDTTSRQFENHPRRIYLSSIISLNVFVLFLFRSCSSNSNFFTSTTRSIICSCCFLRLHFQLSRF